MPVYAGTTGNDTILGSTTADSISGIDGNDVLNGDAGNDTLFGGIGNDTLIGGVGSDRMDGGTNFDWVDYSASSLGVTVSLLSGVGTGGDAAGDVIVLNTIEAILGSGANDSLTGDGLDNALSGGNGNDSLFGGSGLDTLIGGAGVDRLDGGAGIDMADYSTSALAVNVTINGSSNTGGDAAGDVLVAIENLTGSALDDTLTGDGGNNAILGGLGADRILGGVGNDSLFGDDGIDTLLGGAGADSLDGGIGMDTADYSASTVAVSVTVNGSANTGGDAAGDTLTGIENLIGSASNDTLIGDANDNILAGGAGQDSITGGMGSDTVDYSASASGVTINLADGSTAGGDAEGDVLAEIENVFGTAFQDSLTGSLGNNLFQGGAGADTLVGGGGIDTLSYASSAVGVSVNLLARTASGGDADGDWFSGMTHLIGSLGHDLLTGSDVANHLTGGVGNDTLYGGVGADTMVGGLGNDTFRVDNVMDVVTENAGEGTDLVLSSVTWTLGENAEHLTLEGFSAINGTGNGLNNLITGNSYSGTFALSNLGNNLLAGLGGNDTLIGNAGNDTLDGGTGTDSMVGGIGNDTYYVDAATDVVVELSGEGVDTVISSLAYVLTNASVENLTLSGLAAINGTGSLAANILTGNEADNQLFGMAGLDTLNGGGGNDSLDGGTGADSMTGGLGNDTYVVDDLGDKVIEVASGGTDSVQSSISLTLGLHVENLTLTGGAAINGTGNTLNNQITGNGASNILTGGLGNDSLYGGGGTDTLDGGAGADLMTGGAGTDFYYVDSTADVVTETAGGGTDTVFSFIDWTLGAEFENLTLGDRIAKGTGNAVANVLTGNASANTLSGLDGNDTVNGGAGNDTLTGGNGADHFVFRSGVVQGLDTITDFNALRGGAAQGDVLHFQGMLVGTFAYMGGAAFSGGSNNSEARVSGSQLQVDADGNGILDFSINLTGLTNATQLSALDFLWT